MNDKDFEKIKSKYIATMRPILKRRALFSDMTEEYVTPVEPNEYARVKIRFRAAKDNIDMVYLVCEKEKQLMQISSKDTLFDYYECDIQLENKTIHYHFEIKAGNATCYYDKRGPVKEVENHYEFRLVPGFATPDWAKGAVMYQLYVDRFYNGDPNNDVQTGEYFYIDEHVRKIEEWDKYPDVKGTREFYGGDLQGVLDKLDYLEDLGVQVIYFNPLFVSPSNHKYDIQDYDYIDPHFGKIVHDEGELLKEGQKENRFATKYIDRVTNRQNLEASNDFFVHVVEEIHKRGMKVILDGVFNHCGSFNKWMDRERLYEDAAGYDKGAFVSENSPYRHYFDFKAGSKWPYNTNYDGWWGYSTLPKLNFEGSKDLYNYILGVAKKWVSPPFNVDGWRLDVAADLAHSPEVNHAFWRDFRRVVKEANPDAIILAEHYGCAKEWLLGDEWDTVMNYDAFMEPVTWFLTGMQKHSDDFRPNLLNNADAFFGAMKHHSAAFTSPSLAVAMNELSNHDHSRFLTRTNRTIGRTNSLGANAANQGINKAVFREAVIMQMTWAGAPTIYYGDEAGVCGFTDPDNRRTYPWGHEDLELIDFHKEIIRIHKENKEFLYGSLKQLQADNNVVAYGRFNKEEKSVVLVNNNDFEVKCKINTWEIGIPRAAVLVQLIKTTEEGHSVEPVEYPTNYGKVEIILPKTSAIVLKWKKN